jgi:Homeodomain-like domain-containing protein
MRKPHAILEKEPMAEDAFLQALTALEDVMADNDRRSALIRKRMARIRRARERGIPYSASVADEDGPLIVQLITESSTALDNCGANVRRAEAQALYQEGMTMERIAKYFGVTRQRVSALLRRSR